MAYKAKKGAGPTHSAFCCKRVSGVTHRFGAHRVHGSLGEGAGQVTLPSGLEEEDSLTPAVTVPGVKMVGPS